MIEAGKLEIVPEKFYTLSLLNDMYEIAKARNNEKVESEQEQAFQVCRYSSIIPIYV